MFVRETKRLLLAGAMSLVATPVRAQLQPPAVKPTVADEKAKAASDDSPELGKQLDDALRQLDKLNKVIPDDARENMRKRLLEMRPAPAPPPRAIGTAYTIGMQLHPLPPLVVEQLQLPGTQGLVINDVRPETLAAKSGLLKYDILMEFNGKPVPNNANAFNNDLKDIKQGAELTFGVLRRGKKESIKSVKVADVAPLPVPNVAVAPKVAAPKPPLPKPAPPKAK